MKRLIAWIIIIITAMCLWVMDRFGYPDIEDVDPHRNH